MSHAQRAAAPKTGHRNELVKNDPNGHEHDEEEQRAPDVADDASATINPAGGILRIADDRIICRGIPSSLGPEQRPCENPPGERLGSFGSAVPFFPDGGFGGICCMTFTR